MTCTSLNSSSFPLSDSLSLSDSVLACINPCFSRQGSLNNRSDSLSEFSVSVITMCDLITMCQGSPTQSSKFIGSHASLKVCFVQLLPRTIPLLVMYEVALGCSCSIMMTNKDSVNYAFHG